MQLPFGRHQVSTPRRYFPLMRRADSAGYRDRRRARFRQRQAARRLKWERDNFAATMLSSWDRTTRGWYP